MAMLLKNADGKESFSFSVALVSFIVVMVWMTASIFEKVGSIHIRQFDSTAALAVLSTTFGLYAGRKQQELVQSNKSTSTPSSPPPSE